MERPLETWNSWSIIRLKIPITNLFICIERAYINNYTEIKYNYVRLFNNIYNILIILIKTNYKKSKEGPLISRTPKMVYHSVTMYIC